MEIYHPQDEELIREMRRVRRSGKRKRILWGLLIGLVLSAAFGWFVFAVLALEFAKGHCAKGLSCLSALSIVLFTRAGRVAQCVLMVVGVIRVADEFSILLVVIE